MNKNTEVDNEELEMWLEKLNRPGRLRERNGEIITKEKLLEMMEEDTELEEEEDEDEQEDEDDMLEMWLEKLNRPGRLRERNGEVITKENLLEMMANDEM